MIVQQQQMAQTLSRWILVCPVKTATLTRETLSVRSVLLLFKTRFNFVHLESYASLETLSVCLYIDLRGIWRGSGGV